METYVDHHSEKYLFQKQFDDEMISLLGVEGKYYVNQNGNHRLTMLKARYLTEIKRAKNDKNRIEQIEREYSVLADSAVDVPENPKELVGMSLIIDLNQVMKTNQRIAELIKDGVRVGYQVQERGKIIELTSQEQINSFIDEQMKMLEERRNYLKKWKRTQRKYMENEKYSGIYEEIIGERGRIVLEILKEIDEIDDENETYSNR